MKHFLYNSSLTFLSISLLTLIALRIKETFAEFETEYNKGIDAFKNNDFKLALSYFNKSIFLKPDNSASHYNLGLTFLALKKNKEAKNSFIKTLELNPTDADAIYNIGLLFLHEENFNVAIENFFKALDLKKNEPDFYYNLGVALLNLNKHDESIEQVSMACALNPKNLEYKVGLAYIYEKKSESNGFQFLEYAINIYNEILPSGMFAELCNFRLSICFAKKGEWEDSVKFCQKAIELNPYSYEAYNQLGLAIYCNGDIDSAISFYKKSLTINSTFLDAYKNIAFAYEKKNEIKEAIYYFNKFVELAPNASEIEIIKEHLKELKNTENPE